MAEQAGIDLMRRRIERASRQPPPPRRAADSPEPRRRRSGTDAGAGAGGAASAPRRRDADDRRAASPAARRGRPARRACGWAPTWPPVNLAIRVRRPLDDRLADIIHGLRGQGVRTSKVELIEMLLWELPDDDLPAVRERLRQFRDWAPRGTSAPLEAE